MQCDCGNTKQMLAEHVKRGMIKSCGCRRSTAGRPRPENSTHGMSAHPAYWVWRSMCDRCRLPSHKAWLRYGGRGIKVCAAWSNSFEAFWRDMGPTYVPGLSLEREDNNGGYDKKNCVWATRITQNRNKRSNVMLDTPWGYITMTEAAEKSGIGKTTLHYRVSNGWPLSRLFDPPNCASPSTTF